jgi:hypothetical protein
MKIKSSLLILAILWLSACTPAATVAPTATSTTTSTPTPAPTATATLPPTPTKVSLPPFMDEFVQKGYDQQPLDKGAIYVVFDTTSTAYPPDEAGLEYKGVVTNSWTAIYYIDSGTLVKAYVLNSACSKSKTDWKGYLCIDLLGGSGSSDPFPATTKWARAIWPQVYAKLSAKLSTSYPIARLELEHGISTSTEVLQNLYPPYSGKIELVEIPGIGKVIAAQYLHIDIPAK